MLNLYLISVDKTLLMLRKKDCRRIVYSKSIREACVVKRCSTFFKC